MEGRGYFDFQEANVWNEIGWWTRPVEKEIDVWIEMRRRERERERERERGKGDK